MFVFTTGIVQRDGINAQGKPDVSYHVAKGFDISKALETFRVTNDAVMTFLCPNYSEYTKGNSRVYINHNDVD